MQSKTEKVTTGDGFSRSVRVPIPGQDELISRLLAASNNAGNKQKNQSIPTPNPAFRRRDWG